MTRIDRLDIHERRDAPILIDHAGRRLASQDLAEYTGIDNHDIYPTLPQERRL
jgi:hypothetical protein